MQGTLQNAVIVDSGDQFVTLIFCYKLIYKSQFYKGGSSLKKRLTFILNIKNKLVQFCAYFLLRPYSSADKKNKGFVFSVFITIF